MAYAAGAVPESFSLVIAAHLEKCARCRGRVADAEDLGGELLSGLPKEDLSADGLAQVWARIEQETPFDLPNASGIPPLRTCRLFYKPIFLTGSRAYVGVRLRQVFASTN